MAVRKYLTHTADSVSAGKLITLNVPCFHSICQLFLEFTNSGAAATLANIQSSISNINVLANGEEILNITPANLTKVYQSLGTQVGTTTPVNVLPLFLGPLLYKLPAAEDLFQIGCEGYSKDANGNWQPLTNLQVQIQCGGTITSVTNVQVNSERVDKGTGLNLTSAICKTLSYFQAFTTTGTSEVDTLPRDSNIGRLFTLAIPDATGVIADGESLVNNMPVYQKSSIAANNMLVAQRGFSPVSGVFNFSYTDGGTNDLLSMQGVTDMRDKVTFSTAPTTGYTLVDTTVRAVA